MIFNQVLGNINDIKDLNNLHIEKIYISSEDSLKRIMRVNSDHNHEYGIALSENIELKDGDILYHDDKNIIIVKIKGDDVLVIKPNSMTDMGIIAHALGNRHYKHNLKMEK